MFRTRYLFCFRIRLNTSPPRCISIILYNRTFGVAHCFHNPGLKREWLSLTTVSRRICLLPSDKGKQVACSTDLSSCWWWSVFLYWERSLGELKKISSMRHFLALFLQHFARHRVSWLAGFAVHERACVCAQTYTCPRACMIFALLSAVIVYCCSLPTSLLSL